jgi:hypothetical protein
MATPDSLKLEAKVAQWTVLPGEKAAADGKSIARS